MWIRKTEIREVIRRDGKDLKKIGGARKNLNKRE